MSHSEISRQPSFSANIPSHLPRKLSISCWIWSWITSATATEPYGDLERCARELKERGFNAVRVDAGLNWAFRLDGTPRGPMEFCAFVPGYGWNFSTCNSVGGGRHDVLKRLIHLFELAKQYDFRVILTSWEYQDSSWFVADPAIRAEVYSVPPERRFMHLAEQHDRLLRILKDRGLAEQVAFVEVHNEPEHSEFPKGPEGVEQHRQAIAFLRERHPDILVSGDFSSHDDFSIIPDNVQVFDDHIYAGADWYFQELYGKTIYAPDFDPHHPRKLATLDRILRKDVVPWDTFMQAAENIRAFWRPVMWLFENLDNDRWDEWAAESFTQWKDRIWTSAKTFFAKDAQEAQRRGLPMVFDEGGCFYPPRLSRFEISPTGLTILELFTDLAIQHGYWGFMPGTYCGPEHLLWQERKDWLQQTNERFQRS